MKHYAARLADGQHWEFSAEKKVEPLTQRLAEILGMRENGRGSKDCVRLFFKSSPQRGFTNFNEHLRKGYFLVRFASLPRSRDIICEFNDGGANPDLDLVRMWQALAPISRRNWQRGGLTLHGALVERGGQGYILAGEATVGKTTCCRRLPREWGVLSDDETLIVRDKKGNYFGHPLPSWSCYIARGKEHLRRRKGTFESYIPIKAVFFLRQAKIDKVASLDKGKALAFLVASALQTTHRSFDKGCEKDNIEYRKRIFENCCAFNQDIPAFLLSVSLTGKFWNKINYATSREK